MVDLDDATLERARVGQPYFIYQRIPLGNVVEAYFLFPVPYGFWFLLRTVNSIWPQESAAKAYFDGTLKVEFFLRGSGKSQQGVPVSLNLFATPGGDGISIDGINRLTCGEGPKGAKLQNTVYPIRDTIEIRVTGHDPLAIPIHPLYVDIALLGYLIPDSRLDLWKGTANGTD